MGKKVAYVRGRNWFFLLPVPWLMKLESSSIWKPRINLNSRNHLRNELWLLEWSSLVCSSRRQEQRWQAWEPSGSFQWLGNIRRRLSGFQIVDFDFCIRTTARGRAVWLLVSLETSASLHASSRGLRQGRSSAPPGHSIRLHLDSLEPIKSKVLSSIWGADLKCKRRKNIRGFSISSSLQSYACELIFRRLIEH